MTERSVFLVRHGEVENPRGVMYGRLPGFELSRDGQRNVKGLAERIRSSGIVFTKAYSSPLERAFQTAEILGEVLGCEVELTPEIIEIDVSFLTGKTKLELAKIIIPHGFDIYGRYYTEKGVESAPNVMKRMRNFVDEKLKSTQGNFAIVSHGDPLILLLWTYLYRDKRIPSTLNLANNVDYIKKGKAIAIYFDEAGMFLRFNKFK
ncbi:MAG: hypothetical protein A2735_02565 [Candidatus Yanofskybacteria bacterium RIFCSPHIGHO2_01_FULL_41_21]|uniref:Phosphoglycerate mutase n=1 Tax=Candidatus Yanofskybacteria bacterium RIFCSPHIGHO2_01_FULL_41_21 TaxID=1802660 RepID=A0A1F8EBV2_9BACT|nr:MAG: hypothetical protein A2735_02565 [Candidatus Yanofskybacteria bacterium RIFCSPHIGHO2_01_FULL_41_21]